MSDTYACDDRPLHWGEPHPGSSDTKYRYHKTTVTYLPLNAYELYFVAQGALAQGTFDVEQGVAPGQTQAELIIDVHYNHRASLRHLRMCRIHDRANLWGFGIYVSLDVLSSALIGPCLTMGLTPW